MVINVVNISDEISYIVWNMHSGLAILEGPREDKSCLNNHTSSWCNGSELGEISFPSACARGHLAKSRHIWVITRERKGAPDVQ